MKRIVTTYLIIFLIPTLLFGQKQAVQKDSVTFYRHSFSVELGTHYNYFPGDGYIQPLKLPAIDPGPYGGLTKKSSFNIQAGFLYTYHFNKSIAITSGLSYYNRKRILLRSAAVDTIDPSLYFLSPYIEYRTSSNSIEIPLLIGYSIKKFSVLLGTKFKFLNIWHTYRKTTSEEVNYYRIQIESRSYDLFYHEARLKYTIINGKMPMSIYIAANAEDLNFRNLDFLAGFHVRFMNKKKWK